MTFERAMHGVPQRLRLGILSLRPLEDKENPLKVKDLRKALRGLPANAVVLVDVPSKMMLQHSNFWETIEEGGAVAYVVLETLGDAFQSDGETPIPEPRGC